MRKFEILLALRWLTPKKGEGFVSVAAMFSLLGIALGVAALVVVLSVMNGFRQDLTERLLNFSGHIWVYDTSGEVVDFITPNAEKVAKVTQTQALAIAKGSRNTGVVVRAVDPLLKGVLPKTLASPKTTLQEPAPKKPKASTDTQPAPETPNTQPTTQLKPRTALVGEELAQRLGIGKGNHFTLLSPEPQVNLFGAAPKLMRFEVGGVFQTGNYQYDNFYLFIPEQDAAALFGKLKPRLEVSLADPYKVDEFQLLLQAQFPNVLTNHWKQQNKELFAALDIEKKVMTIILALIILVAALNIVSALVIQVKNRTKEIAVLRSLGCSKTAVLRIVMWNGMILGITGVAVGVAGGLAIAANLEAIRLWLENFFGINLFAQEIYLLAKLPSDIHPAQVWQIAGFALAITALASLYPSIKAARQPPAQGFRINE